MKKKDIPKEAKYYVLPTPGEDMIGTFYFYLKMLDRDKRTLYCNKYRFRTHQEAVTYCRKLRDIFKEVGLIEKNQLYESSAPRGHQYPYIR